MIKILLVTATKTETQAVQEVFSAASSRSWERQVIGDKTYYDLGHTGHADVFLVQSEMGTAGRGAALLTVHNAIRDLTPSVVIMVGIAFGTRPEKQKLGDILVSSQLQTYELQKIKGGKVIQRGDRVTASTRLLDKFRSGDLDWHGANVHFGLVLSGEKLVADQDFRAELLALAPEAIGGEMEGAGLYAAATDANLDWILVKAICDWGDEHKDDASQLIAARNAASFVLHVIQQGGILPQQKTKRIDILLEGEFGEFGPIQQRDLISMMCALLKLDPTEVRVLYVRNGSILIGLEMPDSAAHQLLAYARQIDFRLQHLHITMVQLEGEPPAHLGATATPAPQPPVVVPASAAISVGNISNATGVAIGHGATVIVGDATPNIQFPRKSYRELVGRDALVGETMAALRDPAGKWIVALDGMGGIGKTALAREIADRALVERLFNVVVWEQAPKEQLTSSDRGKAIGTLTYETALDAIARQLGTLDVPRLQGAEKEARVRALLQTQRVLVVLDNLETAKEPQNEIARRLQPLLNPSKALLTSRHRFTGELYAVHLPGLDEDSALRLIRQEAQEKGINRVAGASIDELQQVARATGGSPLALKLVVGQLSHLPLDIVLRQLREVRLPQGDSDEDDYVRFYKGIFFPSWGLLSEEGKRLLISMAHFAPNVGGTLEAIKATSDLADDGLTRSVNDLWRLSFLEIGESPRLNKVRYYLHALTQYFVLSDIVQVLK